MQNDIKEGNEAKYTDSKVQEDPETLWETRIVEISILQNDIKEGNEAKYTDSKVPEDPETLWRKVERRQHRCNQNKLRDHNDRGKA